MNTKRFIWQGYPCKWTIQEAVVTGWKWFRFFTPAIALNMLAIGESVLDDEGLTWTRVA